MASKLLADFLNPEVTISDTPDGKVRFTLPDGRYFAFDFGGFVYSNPNAEPMKASPLLQDFLDKRVGKPDDPADLGDRDPA